MAHYCEVVFNLPLPGSFTYLNTDQEGAGVGMRVRANFGKRKNLLGYVIAEASATDIAAEKLKKISRVLDKEAIFGEAEIALGRRMAELYFCSLGEALATIIPGAGSLGRKKRAQLKQAEDPAEEVADLSLGEGELPRRQLDLSDEQKKALAILEKSPEGLFYLYGVTGTGKTEVFLQAAEAVLARGGGVIYLVPEIALSSQIEADARRRFGDQCAILHSHLTAATRLREWKRIRRGEANLVIGARSAIFAPLARLSLIIIDEEHETSYKAGDTPRYHVRHLAQARRLFFPQGQRPGILMGSATPSLEAWHLIETGSLEKLTLTKRLSGGGPSRIEVVDLGKEATAPKALGQSGPRDLPSRPRAGLLSKPLIKAMEEAKAQGRQSILFLNRRGFQHWYRCSACRHELHCKNCSVTLSYHRSQAKLLCHYCGYTQALPQACPSCGALELQSQGFGTERVEEELRNLFPNYRLARLDSDVAAQANTLLRILKEFREGELDILLGTQMVAKGLNFPRLKTVGIILADASLNLPDFRCFERSFSLFTQVAGRTGRFFPDGEVFIQSYRPDHAVLRFAQAQDIEGFYTSELAARESFSLPPYSRLARLIFRSRSEKKAKEAAQRFAQPHSSQAGVEGLRILGPVEAPLKKIAGNYRYHLVLSAADLKNLHRGLAGLLTAYQAEVEMRRGVYLEVDVDPLSLL